MSLHGSLPLPKSWSIFLSVEKKSGRSVHPWHASYSKNVLKESQPLDCYWWGQNAVKCSCPIDRHTIKWGITILVSVIIDTDGFFFNFPSRFPPRQKNKLRAILGKRSNISKKPNYQPFTRLVSIERKQLLRRTHSFTTESSESFNKARTMFLDVGQQMFFCK